MEIKLPKSKIFMVLMLLLLSCVMFAQSAGDYRSAGNGNWTDLASWERFDATLGWQTPTVTQGYPGQNVGTGDVLVQANHTIAIDNIGISTKPLGTLTIDGTMSLTGNSNSTVLFYFDTKNLVITPGLTPYAKVVFNNKVNLGLPQNASIVVGTEGLPTPGAGACNNNIEISIGSAVSAYCTGGGKEIDFSMLITNGGYNIVKVTPESDTSCGPQTFLFTATAFPSSGATIKWYTVATGETTIQTGTAGSADTFRPNVSSTTTYYVEAAYSEYTTPRKQVVATVNPASVGGTVAGSTTVCTGTNSTVLILSGHTGSVVRWESSTDNFTTVTSTANTSTSLTATNLTATTSYRAVLKSGTCAATNSAVAAVTVSEISSAPTVGVLTQPNCTTSKGSVELTGLPAGNWTINPGNITGSTSSVTVPNLNSGTTYNFTVTNSAGCISVASADVNFSSPVTKTWAGGSDWSPAGPPTINDRVVFTTNYTSTTNVDACACEVRSGATVTFNSGHTLKVANEVDINTTGSLIFENNASLVQTNDNAANAGNITYKRTTPTILKTDYVYWSTPVAEAKLEKIQTGTLYYSFNATVNNWTRVYASTTMTTGMGYIVRGEGTWFDTGSVTLTPKFFGAPNNGVKTVAIVGGRSNLIGNPYPSALYADAFIKANTAALAGALYFWTHKSAIQLASNITNGTAGSGVYAYTSDDYAAYNLTGGTATVANSDKTLDDKFKPTGKIAAGQAFFAPATAAGGTATFNNSMRLDKEVLDNSQFFKPGKASKTTNSIEKNRVWLNLINAGGAFKQTLIGYITGATNDYDNIYDGVSVNANAFIDFYSINNDKNLVIQGRALPFDDNDKVPLGYKTNIVGEFKIAIDEADGILANKNIILEDKLLNITQDLSLAPYTFTTEKGTFNNRFILSYANKTTVTEDFETVENKVMITNKNKEVKIRTPENEIEAVFIYDISGKQIYSKSKVDKNELVVTTLIAREQVLIVKVILKDKSIITKKTTY